VVWLLASQETEKLSFDSLDVLAPAPDCWAPGPSDTNPGPVVDPTLRERISMRVAVQWESDTPPR
jgi:hypothetical protein